MKMRDGEQQAILPGQKNPSPGSVKYYSVGDM